MTLNLIQHIDSPAIALFAACVAVVCVAVLPWTDAELRRSAAAGRASLGLVASWVQGLQPSRPAPMRVQSVGPRRRRVRFARSL